MGRRKKDGFCRAPRLEMVANDMTNVRFEDLMKMVKTYAKDEKCDFVLKRD